MLDEPNSNLDRLGEAALLRTLKTLRARGTTVIVVAHHASILEAVDKLLLMRDGRAEAFGPKDKVLAHISGGSPVQTGGPGETPGQPMPVPQGPTGS